MYKQTTEILVLVGDKFLLCDVEYARYDERNCTGIRCIDIVSIKHQGTEVEGVDSYNDVEDELYESLVRNEY